MNKQTKNLTCSEHWRGFLNLPSRSSLLSLKCANRSLSKALDLGKQQRFRECHNRGTKC